MKDRTFMLELLSGLTVIFDDNYEHKTNKKDHRYTFLHGKRVVRGFFNYRKALVFAQGVNLGRSITLMEWESTQ